MNLLLYNFFGIYSYDLEGFYGFIKIILKMNY